ncbi:uncharacterized protein LOC132255438 [Phlebotomus argentipes]|uniref:uncharacterized protein LOC132255438 n=1 Tax=Phlebotomus argentipes TaxID=94469 RepID=UPI0028937BE4|nr:uncharacterized protein LOC132255438 [Phlebotomus argentipes]
MDRQKRRRTIERPMKRWTLEEESKILDFLIANKPIELPTAKMYYSKLIQTLEWTINYSLVRHKVKNMKQLYFKMLSWRQSAIENDDYDEQMIKEHLKRRCPHFKKLESLFSTELRAKKATQSCKPQKVEEINLCADEGEDPSMEDFKVEYSVQDLDSRASDESGDPLRAPREVLDMNKEQVSLQWMRLEIEKEKLSIAREKIAMLREQNQEEAKFRILQLEQQGILKKLQIEKDTEVRKYELSLKYKADLKSEI